VTQDAAAAPTSLMRLPDNIVDAAYDKPLDKMVYVSSAPNELHFYDTAAHTDRVTFLVMAPLAVSVSPDGQYAAVGHDGWMSYVNLTNGAVIRVFQEITDVHTLALA
jgi:chitinase